MDYHAGMHPAARKCASGLERTIQKCAPSTWHLGLTWTIHQFRHALACSFVPACAMHADRRTEALVGHMHGYGPLFRNPLRTKILHDHHCYS